MAERKVAGAQRPGRRVPEGYRAYLRTGGRLAIPRSTAYDIKRRNRNALIDAANKANNVRPHLNAGPQNLRPGMLDEKHHQVDDEEELDDPVNYDNASEEDVPNEPLPEEPVQNDAEMMGDVLLDDLQEREENDRGPVLGPQVIDVDEHLQEEIAPNLTCTKFETLLLILHFALRHGLTAKAVEDLCSMVNIILGGNIIPTSTYVFKKIFAGDMPAQFHMICNFCQAYIGVITQELRNEKSVPCRICQTVCNVPGLSGKDFFVTLPMKNQIADLLQNMDDVMDQLNYRWNRNDSDTIEDVFDGKIYKDLCKDGNFLSHRYNLSLSFNTDGARVFDSGCTTLWPIFFRLNELKPECRFEESNVMLAGLWFGQKEPTMATYFKTFLFECRDLYENGITWKPKNSNRVIQSKIITLSCSLDSVAKPLLQCSKQFNGYNSCPYCDHPGVTYDENEMYKWPMHREEVALTENLEFLYRVDRYDEDDNLRINRVRDKNNKIMRKDMEIAENQRANIPAFDEYKGLIGKSPMCFLPFFDVCVGFQIDYLHAVLIGTAKHLASMWFDSCYKGSQFYIRNYLPNVDSRLLALTPPTSISRRTRSLNQKSDWHANEWRSWLLFYSLPCLKGFLPAAYLKHHCLLVSSIHTLLQSKITGEELISATWALGEYVNDFQILYGKEEMYFNVHLLLHLGKSVLLWGPLHLYSMFSYENANNGMVKLVRGTRGVASQIVLKYSVSRYLPHLVPAYNISDVVLKFCSDLVCYRRFSTALKVGDSTLIGNQKLITVTEEERRAFHANGLPLNGLFYERMLRKRTLFDASLYSRKGTRSDNTIVRLINGSYGIILRIFQRTDGAVALLLRQICVGNGYITYHACGSKAKHIKVCRPIIYGNLFFANAQEIGAKSIFLDCGNDKYIAEFPNMLEKD